MPDFSHRSRQKEIMDDLQCKGDVLIQTLRELAFINRWLGGNRVTVEAVKNLIKGHKKEGLHIADLGCGSGDMLRLLAEWGRKNNTSLRLTGIDANPNIIEHARRHCASYPEISFEVLNVFSADFQQRKYDVVLGTLFFHNFSDEALTHLFSSFKTQARIGFVINDIHRHWLAYYSIRTLTALFSRSSMARFDAPLSVLRAFSRDELRGILTKAGIESPGIRWKWAFRWQVWHSFY